MAQKLWDLFDEADIVIGLLIHDKFDSVKLMPGS